MDTSENMRDDWLSVDLVNRSHTKELKILTETVKDDKSQYGPRWVCEVVLDGNEHKWKVNKTTNKLLSHAWLPESKNWIGKTVRLQIEKIQGHDAIIGHPLAMPQHGA